MNKFAKIIKYIFIIALIAFLAAFFLRVFQSDYQGLKDIKITDSFVSAYKSDNNVRTHAVNDNGGFSENGAIFAYSFVYMKDSGYFQFSIRYNTRHMDEVKETYPEFSEEQIYFVITDSNGNTYEPKKIDSERKYNYQYFKLELSDIEDFDADFTVQMILGDLPENVSKKNILVLHKSDDTSIPFEFSKKETELLK